MRAYRIAYDLARHYRDEIVPLRKTIADEMLLYNGMLIGVFELLADSREQIGSVMQAIERSATSGLPTRRSGGTRWARRWRAPHASTSTGASRRCH